jgi:hypothetical protein
MTTASSSEIRTQEPSRHRRRHRTTPVREVGSLCRATAWRAYVGWPRQRLRITLCEAIGITASPKSCRGRSPFVQFGFPTNVLRRAAKRLESVESHGTLRSACSPDRGSVDRGEFCTVGDVFVDRNLQQLKRHLLTAALPFQGRESGCGRCPRRLAPNAELGVAVRQMPFHSPHAQMHCGRN